MESSVGPRDARMEETKAQVEAAIDWAEERLGTTTYARLCLALLEDAYEKAIVV